MLKTLLLTVMLIAASISTLGSTPKFESIWLTGCGQLPTPIWTITGRVTSASTGNPIGGVTVTLLASDSHLACQDTKTTVGGYYSFDPVYVPNYYYLQYVKEGYNLREDYDYVFQYMDPINVTLSQ